MKKYNLIISTCIGLIFLLACSQLTYGQQKDFNLRLLSNPVFEFPDEVPSRYRLHNDCWGWEARDGTPYAIIGAGHATLIYNISDPTLPILAETIPGTFSVWRDIKSHDDYLYVVADEGEDGLLIIDMRSMPDSIHWKFWKPDLEANGQIETLRTCHNLFIDKGYIYLAGCNVNDGGILILEVLSDPMTPTFVSAADPRYAHDIYVNGNTMFASDLREGFSMIDISDKNNPTTIATQETSRDFTHNAWGSDDGTLLFTTDERSQAFVDAYDVSDPNEIVLLDKYRPLATIDQLVIPHNVHFYQGFLAISYYTDGLKIVDVHHPENMIEVGSFDTHFDRNSGFNGAWGAYPYFSNGIILVSDLNAGLFILEPTYQRASYLVGQVTDMDTKAPLQEVEVIFLSDLPGKGITDGEGFYQTGIGDTGIQKIRFCKPGYEIAEIERTCMAGATDTLNVELRALKRYSVSGRIIDAQGIGISKASVVVQNDQYQEFGLTDVEGRFSIPVFEGDYQVAAGNWGYNYNFILTPIFQDEDQIELTLTSGYRDDFIFDYGWQVEGNTTASRQWARGKPMGSVYNAEFANPNHDIEGDFGTTCFVTGLSGFLSDNLGDSTILTSPFFDATRFSDPYINYYLWFYNNGVNPPDDILHIYLGNSTGQILVEQAANPKSGWRQRSEIRIKDFLELSDSMYIQIVAADIGNVHIYEAGIDAFSISDGLTVSTSDPAHALTRVFPNPFRDYVQIESNQVNFELSLYSSQGILIKQQKIPTLHYKLFTSQLIPGIYFVAISHSDGTLETYKLIKTN